MSIWNNMDWVPGLRTPFFNVFFELVTLAGYPLFLILFLCFGYFALGSKRFYHTSILLILTGLLNTWLKDFGQDPRPAASFALDGRVGDSYGWPSGHTQVAVVLWGYLAYSVGRNWAYWAAGIFIFLQAFSRLYLGVHDLGDVTAGFVFGALCLAAYIYVQRSADLNAKLSSLALPQMAAAVFGVHMVFLLVYPAHEGHAAPYWFVGLMMGWLVGRYWRKHEEVALPGPLPVQMIVASLMTASCFVLMLVTTRGVGKLISDDNALTPAVEYGAGAVFGLAVVALLPWLVSTLAARFNLHNQSS